MLKLQGQQVAVDLHVYPLKGKAKWNRNYTFRKESIDNFEVDPTGLTFN
jgi:hypothetical protein